MRNLVFLLLLFPFVTFGQNFTHSGKILTGTGSPAENVAVKLYRRTNSTITGFTSQTNYNGHSYYRSTTSSTWTSAKSACENMNGHLATVSSTGENNFLYNTWPSGWIGLYQDKTGAFYSEPNGGWRWTENPASDYSHNFDSKNYTTTLVDNINSKNATMYNGPVRTTSGGDYVQFDGVNDYAITGNLASSFPNSSNVQTIQLLCYPQDPGVLVSELGVASASSGWHEAVMEITTSGTLKVGLWNGTAIASISSTIAMNTWHLITMTYDGSTLRGYLDGDYFGATTFSRDVPHAYSGNGMYYALGKEDATNMGNGTYANFRLGAFQIYNRALSADEIDRNWMSISYRYGRMKYTNWNGGEPNNSGNEDYIQFVGLGKWNDLPNTTLPYVIEFDYIVTTSSWAVYQTKYTDSLGNYSFSVPTDPSKEYYIEITATNPVTALTLNDTKECLDISIGKKALTGNHYFVYDVNGDSKITVSDAYQISARRMGIFAGWTNIFTSRLFTKSQFQIIQASSTNLKGTYPGVTTLTVNSPTSGGTSDFYLITPGYSSKVKF